MINFVLVTQHKQHGYFAPVIYLYTSISNNASPKAVEQARKEAKIEAKSKSRLADFPEAWTFDIHKL